MKPEYIEAIERQDEVKQVAEVLAALQEKGLKEPAVASGWIRGWLTNTERSDIDIAYVGDIEYMDAREILKEVIVNFGYENKNWDITGIWNASQEDPTITSTERNYLLYYVNSIDSVYLASDGKLHDPTGFGFDDAKQKILRMNDFYNLNYHYRDSKIVYLCLEGCRRIAKFKWTPLPESVELIMGEVFRWNLLSQKDKEYFYEKKIEQKYPRQLWEIVKPTYDQYGWGFIFDEAVEYFANKVTL